MIPRIERMVERGVVEGCDREGCGGGGVVWERGCSGRGVVERVWLRGVWLRGKWWRGVGGGSGGEGLVEGEWCSLLSSFGAPTVKLPSSSAVTYPPVHTSIMALSAISSIADTFFHFPSKRSGEEC